MSVAVKGPSDPFVQNYRKQIEALEADPNATPSFKQSLDKQLQAVVDQWTRQQGAQAAQPQAEATPDDPAKTVSQVASAPALASASNDPSASTPAPAAVQSSDGGSGASSQLGGNLPDALKRLSPDIAEAAKVTGEDPKLLAAQVWDESRGQTGASTTNGGTGLSDAGLMQVDQATFGELQQKHPELQGKSLGDPLTNLEAGSFYEQDLKRQFGSDELALRAYNSGPGSVDRSDPDKTTTGLGDPNYVQKVEAEKNDIASGTALPS